MALPNIIAGPILRRVEKDQISVWIACTREFTLTLKIYEGDNIELNTESGGFPSPGTGVVELITSSAQAPTVQFGKNLWIGVVRAEMQVPFQTGKIYSYNVRFESKSPPTEKGDLKTDGLLSDDKHLDRPQKALGYKKNVLPSFCLPADDPAKLFIAQASCRKIHGHGLDALAHLDKVIKDNLTKPDTRPQQLFLTGDQVYADDVPGATLRHLGALDGVGLITGAEGETVKVDNGNGAQEIEADIVSFPPYLRKHLMSHFAGFSSGSAHSHLVTFGEFCGLYLNYWSIRSWNIKLLKEVQKIQADNKESVLQEVADSLLDSEAVEDDPNMKVLFTDEFGERPDAFDLVLTEDTRPIFEEDPPGEKFNAWLEKIRAKLKNELREVAEFAKTLPEVSRVLANVPSYMIFDDHEVTDDWFLSKRWNNQVLSKPMGRDVIRNGLMAYAVFQDWGNVPGEYVPIPPQGGDAGDLSERTKFIRKIKEYCNVIANGLPRDNLRSDIIGPMEQMLGFGAEPAKVKWHYDVPTGPTKTFVLDTRTQRTYDSLNSPPGLLGEDALRDQLPNTIPNGNAPFTFVVSAAPVLGLACMEELVQPAAASVVGIKSTTGKNPGLLAGMLKRDFEAWGFNPAAFEGLIERLSNLKKVILLSGDVHYGFSSVLDYWKGSAAVPEARILQFTSSSLKNEEFGLLHLYRSAIVQKLLTGIGDNLEKLGWKDHVLSVSGDVSIRNRNRLRQNPAVIPIAGWEPGATVSIEPDYRWRLTVITDENVRSGDPIQNDIDLEDENAVKEGYKKVVQRHLDNFISGVHRRMVWPSNIGLLKFVQDGTEWKVKHNFIFSAGSRDISAKNVGEHIKHEALLVATGDEATRPELP
ncbi:alkaline phosphatase D family protein [Aliifodinibius sp. S!AR15-10]|uniref:alkaline phosphatase D family protein n=1 Tax=Aliifodinibius sp. S!AR15-10 TaxID=2950437 RepID=UPI00285438B1|nr:alkaline phosphatase D family protein [Aliifodinibius sp. S!AR15-10]MDR8391882.1 alkaline phosphatase D family protein [Aliifodinibius sp. S!AR15-10]